MAEINRTNLKELKKTSAVLIFDNRISIDKRNNTISMVNLWVFLYFTLSNIEINIILNLLHSS